MAQVERRHREAIAFLVHGYGRRAGELVNWIQAGGYSGQVSGRATLNDFAQALADAEARGAAEAHPQFREDVLLSMGVDWTWYTRDALLDEVNEDPVDESLELKHTITQMEAGLASGQRLYSRTQSEALALARRVGELAKAEGKLARLESQLEFLYQQGCCVKLKDGRVATLHGAIGIDQTALALGWTPEKDSKNA